MSRSIICKSCGAEYDMDEMNCPYCGSANYYGQEKEYMRGLAGLKQRMSDLAEIDKKIWFREVIKVVLYIAVIVAIIGGIIGIIFMADKNSQTREAEKIKEEIIYEIQR